MLARVVRAVCPIVTAEVARAGIRRCLSKSSGGAPGGAMPAAGNHFKVAEKRMISRIASQ